MRLESGTKLRSVNRNEDSAGRGVSGAGTLGSNQKSRAKQFYGFGGEGNFTGLYSNDLTASQYNRRVGTQDYRKETSASAQGMHQQQSFHQSIQSNRNLAQVTHPK